MTTGRTEAAHALERLLKICSDGVEGYHLAATSVRTPRLHAALQKNAVEREEIASVLTNALIELGGKPDHRGSLEGAVHRGWLGALGTTHADDAIVGECRRGDQATLVAFADALSHELPGDIRERVRTQLGRIVNAVERLATSEGTQPLAGP